MLKMPYLWSILIAIISAALISGYAAGEAVRHGWVPIWVVNSVFTLMLFKIALVDFSVFLTTVAQFERCHDLFILKHATLEFKMLWFNCL